MGWMARRENLIVTEAGDDLVVYDERTSHLHTLPASIVSVWRQCDGVAKVDEIAIATGMTPAQVEAALRQLREAGLIDGEPVADDQASSRRGFLRKAAIGAAIVSVTAPMAAGAASVAPAGSCWWLSGGDVWVAWPADYAQCQLQDTCFPGGGGGSGGGCYKWTVGQNDPFPGW